MTRWFVQLLAVDRAVQHGSADPEGLDAMDAVAVHRRGAHGDQPHEVAGVGRRDRDKFNGSEAELQAFWTTQGS